MQKMAEGGKEEKSTKKCDMAVERKIALLLREGRTPEGAKTAP